MMAGSKIIVHSNMKTEMLSCLHKITSRVTLCVSNWETLHLARMTHYVENLLNSASFVKSRGQVTNKKAF